MRTFIKEIAPLVKDKIIVLNKVVNFGHKISENEIHNSNTRRC